MASNNNGSNRVLVEQAENALDQMKWEIAEEFGIADKIRQVGWENMPSREIGRIGGEVTKRMVQYAEQQLKSGAQLQ